MSRRYRNANPKPRVAKALQTFLGCQVGEERMALLNSCLDPNDSSYRYYEKWVKEVRKGNLKTKLSECGKRTVFMLTPKGKKLVKRLEDWY